MIAPPLLVSSETQQAAEAALRHVRRVSRGRAISAPTGHASLDAELPDTGWP